jgi:nucleoside 2-deoxyribosyltransferase
MTCVYVASPFGFSAVTKPYYNDVLLRCLVNVGIQVLDPWDDPQGEAELEEARKMDLGEERRERFKAINERLGANNASCIEENADAVLAVLDGVDVDSGTAAEVGFAAGLGKPVVGLRLDTRLAGDNEAAVVNMQVEHFIRSRAGEVFRDVAEAVTALVKLFPDDPTLERDVSITVAA